MLILLAALHLEHRLSRSAWTWLILARAKLRPTLDVLLRLLIGLLGWKLGGSQAERKVKLFYS